MQLFKLIGEGLQALEKGFERATTFDSTYVEQKCAEMDIPFAPIATAISERIAAHSNINSDGSSFAMDSIMPTFAASFESCTSNPYLAKSLIEWAGIANAFRDVESGKVTEYTKSKLKTFGLDTYRGLGGTAKIKEINTPIPTTPTHKEAESFVGRLNLMGGEELDKLREQIAQRINPDYTSYDSSLQNEEMALLTKEHNAIGNIQIAREKGVSVDAYAIFGLRPVEAPVPAEQNNYD